MNMISSKKHPSRLVRKWQKMASMGRKAISSPTVVRHRKPLVAEKGHFVVYTTDQKRFVFPLMYLNSSIFLELLKDSEEEFGLSTDGPIILPCDAVFMDYIVSLIQKGEAKGLEKALLSSSTASHCSFSASFHQVHVGQRSSYGY